MGTVSGDDSNSMQGKTGACVAVDFKVKITKEYNTKKKGASPGDIYLWEGDVQIDKGLSEKTGFSTGYCILLIDKIA
jgi:hypothetical protein